jgi:hypothetical protein
MYYIGMDLHKNTSTFAIKDKDGNVIDNSKVPTESSAIKGYLKQFPRARLAVEPVSQWYYYADLIQNLGIDARITNPAKVKAIASARIKTDKIDANVLCDLLRANLLPEAYFASPKVRFWILNNECIRWQIKSQTEKEFIAELNGYMYRYNYQRRHSALKYQTPLDKLKFVTEIVK